MRTGLKALIAFCVLAGIVTIGYFNYRNNAMERLYAEAAGYPQFFQGTTQSVDAVRQLATYRGRRATQMLLALARGHGPLVWGDTQVAAIKALEKRHDPQVPLALADLLQPHEGLATRQAAAVALQSLPCEAECLRSILHYLERVWRGEPNYEDRIERPPAFQDVTSSLRKDQQALYADLYGILRRERTQTLMILIKIYGLGSQAPSPFALDLISRLELRVACPPLLQSNRSIQKLSPEFYRAPRQELQAAIASLKCE
jgi:HEAT repeat protein